MSVSLAKTSVVLRDQMQAGLHIGAQVAVDLRGELSDLAIGESRPGTAMSPDTIMPWLSGSKPVAAVAIAMLWERDGLDLDDRVTKFIPEFAAKGKDAITLRHLLTHTGGFRQAVLNWPAAPWEKIIATICAMSIEPDWVPGKKAGYHPFTSWFILGEIVRRIDGRPYEQFAREEILLPLGMTDSFVAMSAEEYRRLNDRIGVMQRTEGGTIVDAKNDDESRVTASRPGGGMRGPMRELARFYRMMLDRGQIGNARIVSPQTVEAMTARHRVGMFDHSFKHVIDFGLGFIINSAQYGPDTVPYGYGRFADPRTFGHGGNQALISFADPENDLAAAIVCNGWPGEEAHRVRMNAVIDALYDDLDLS